MILLIRHAEKSPAGEQYLTSQGLDDALNYGKQLKQQGMQLDEIISSPVKRCIQTSEKIVEGLQSGINIQKSHLLGEPGIFVTDDKEAATLFDKFTVCEVINKIIKGEELPGFLPIEDDCTPLIDEIQTKIALNRSVLYISHDAIIMPFIAYLSRIKEISESEIIDYLDGYVVAKKTNGNSQVLLCWYSSYLSTDNMGIFFCRRGSGDSMA